MQLNHSLPPNHGNRVSSLLTGDFLAAKTLGRWVGALWRSLCFFSGITTPSDRIFHNHITTSGGLCFPAIRACILVLEPKARSLPPKFVGRAELCKPLR